MYLYWLPPMAFLMSSSLDSSLEKMQRWDERGQCLRGLESMNYIEPPSNGPPHRSMNGCSQELALGVDHFFVTVFFLGACYKQRSFQGLVHSTHQYHTCHLRHPCPSAPWVSPMWASQNWYSLQTSSFSGTSNFGILMPDIDGARKVSVEAKKIAKLQPR